MGLLFSLRKTQNLDIRTSEELAAFMRGGHETPSGVAVSVKEALKVSAWYAGNANVAEDIAKMPFILYYTGDERRRATDSPLWRLVHDRWSTRWTSQQGREYMTFWAKHDGNAYALKSPRGAAVPRELLPIPRGEARHDLTDDGEFVYEVKLNGGWQTLTRRDVFHLEGFALNHNGGADLFRMSRDDLGLSLATERHGGAFFGNGGATWVIVEHPGEMSDAAYQRLLTSLREDHTGANAHRGLLLEEGAKASKGTSTNEEGQFLETRQFQVTDHARRLRLPPHKVGDNSHATFSNIEHQTIEYAVDSLLPWALRWENAFNQQIIASDRVYAELLFDMLLRADSKTRAEFYLAAIDHGWMTQNEVRRRENLAPVPGGDQLFSQLNLATPTDREISQLKGRTEAALRLVRAGYAPNAAHAQADSDEGVDVLTVVGLPQMAYVGTPPATTPTDIGDPIDRDAQVAS